MTLIICFFYTHISQTLKNNLTVYTLKLQTAMLKDETIPHGTRLIDLGVFRTNLKQCSKCNSGTQLLS